MLHTRAGDCQYVLAHRIDADTCPMPAGAAASESLEGSCAIIKISIKISSLDRNDYL